MKSDVDTSMGVGYSQTTSQSFSESYFYEELNRFRQFFTDASWMSRSQDDKDACINGLAFVYLNTVPNDNSKVTQELINKWGQSFDSVIMEYHRRNTMIMVKDDRPDCPLCKRPHGVAKVDGSWKCFMVEHSQPVVCG